MSLPLPTSEAQCLFEINVKSSPDKGEEDLENSKPSSVGNYNDMGNMNVFFGGGFFFLKT